MEKRQLSKSRYEFLQQELAYWEQNGLLASEQAAKIESAYEVKTVFSFIRIILLLGSVLVGLGILSFIASNWEAMSKLSKFVLIIASFLGFNFAGYRLYPSYPKVARSLIYIGVFIYGAGIFLIGQMFNFGGHFSTAFMFWGLGILPMGVVLRDKLIMLFAHALLLVYINGSFDLHQYPYLSLLIAPVLYYLNKFFNYSKLLTFANNVVALNLLGYTLAHNKVDENWVFLLYFVIGFVMFLLPSTFNRMVFRLQGLLLIGIFGFILTFEDAWNAVEQLLLFPDINLVFALIYLAVLLFLIRSGNLIALAFFCLTIFRFYADTFYDFMPKSLFFILGGCMLLGFGYYFERKRKLQGGLGLEK